MADYERVLRDKMAISRTSQFGVDTPTVPPLTGDETGDEGGATPYGEYSLHFKMILVPWGAVRASYQPQALSLTQLPAQIHRL